MRDRYWATAREKGNLWFLGGALMLALLGHAPWLLAGALVLEAVYLVWWPRTRWFEARRQRRLAVQRQKQRQLLRSELLPRVRLDWRARYNRLEAQRAGLETQIAEQYPRWVDELPWLHELRERLDALLENFLRLAVRETQLHAALEAAKRDLHRGGADAKRLMATPSSSRPAARNLAEFLVPSPSSTPEYPASLATSLARRAPDALSASPVPLATMPDGRDGVVVRELVREIVREIVAGYAHEVAELERLHEESNADTRAVLGARLEVLRRRCAQTEQTGHILTNLNQQLRLVEDAFGLIATELNARPPEQLLGDVEEVVGQTQSMARVLQELLPGEELP